MKTNTILLEVNPRGYKLKNVKMYVMETICEYVQNFETLYTELLKYTISKAYLTDPYAQSYNLIAVYDEVLELLDCELDRQYIQYLNVKKSNINIKSILDDLEASAERINFEILTKYKYKILTNSIYALHYTTNNTSK